MNTAAPLVNFTLAYWCVLIAALMPYVCAGLAKSNAFKKPGDTGYDNSNPRAWLGQQTGARSRANAAQANCFEAFPFFAAAVVVAHQLGAAQPLLNVLALVFIGLRVVYVALYVADAANFRSVVWMLGVAANIAILFVGYH